MSGVNPHSTTASIAVAAVETATTTERRTGWAATRKSRRLRGEDEWCCLGNGGVGVQRGVHGWLGEAVRGALPYAASARWNAAAWCGAAAATALGWRRLGGLGRAGTAARERGGQGRVGGGAGERREEEDMGGARVRGGQGSGFLFSGKSG